MHPFARLLLLIVIVAVIFWLLTRFRDNKRTEPVTFRPVEDLPQDARDHIDSLLGQGRKMAAIKAYRVATRASPREGTTAIEIWEETRG